MIPVPSLSRCLDLKPVRKGRVGGGLDAAVGVEGVPPNGWLPVIEAGNSPGVERALPPAHGRFPRGDVDERPVVSTQRLPVPLDVDVLLRCGAGTASLPRRSVRYPELPCGCKSWFRTYVGQYRVGGLVSERTARVEKREE